MRGSVIWTLGLVCGAVAGAAAGLLLAPQSGRATRRDLHRSALRARRKAQHLYDRAGDAVEDLTERGAMMLHRAGDMTSQLLRH
jgi:gas vesicle protein